MSVISPTTRRWMTPPPIYEASRARDGTTLKPYLTLPYILSLTWLAYPIISLLFVAFRLQISSASTQDAVSDAKGNLLTSCTAAEKAATAAASLPRYMAAGTNKQIADAVNGTMNAARATLVLSLTILEAVINFVIDIYRSTFFCFLELVVRGGLAILIGAVQEFNTFLSSTFSTIRTSIQSDVSAANSAISSAISAINKVNPFGNISVPQFDIPSLSALQNVTLPSDFEDALTKLNASLPSLDQIRTAIESVVDTPFEDLKADINNTFIGLSFNESTLPVPGQQTLSFCGDLDTSVVDDLGKDLLKAAKIGTIILIFLAVLLLAAHCALEWYKWRCLQQHLEYTRQAWVTDPTMNNAIQNNEAPTLTMSDHNLLMLSADLQHPLLTRIANKLSAIFKLSPSQYTNLSWFFHYVFHPPVLACFLIGFFGLLSVEMQLIAIGPLEAKYTQQVSASVSGFSNTIATSINTSMQNQSATYANQINSQVDVIQTTVNEGLFGWVNGTTTTLNTTLANFYSDIQNAVDTVFNGTILDSPIQEFVKCIIGTKIEAIENALTFLHDNLVINIPQVNQSILLLSQADVDEAVRPISEAAVGGGNDDSQGLVGRLIARYVSSLKQERIMFGVFMGLWAFVVLIALLIIAWHSYGKPLFGSRGKKRYLREQRDFTSFVAPYKPEEYASQPQDEKSEKGMVANDLSSFTPALFNINLRSPSGRNSPDMSGSDQGSHERPPMQRSWDSFLDSSVNVGTLNEAEDEVQGSGKTKRSPRKLMAIGRKAMGRERFISDEERDRRQAAAADAMEEPREQGGWLNRLKSAVRNREQDASNIRDLFDASSNSSSLRSNKPNLTIATNIDFSKVSRDQLPTASGDVPRRSPVADNVPGSAWSISPPPRTVPWLSLNTAAKKPKINPPFNPRAKPRRNASVPLSVNSVYGPSPIGNELHLPSTPAPAITTTSAMREKAAPQTPFSALTPSGVPSYYRSNLPHYAGRDSLLPENSLALASNHRRTSSVPLTVFPPAPPVSQQPQPGAGTRQSELPYVNPFSTPFDDEARVTPPQPPSANPFSPVAV